MKKEIRIYAVVLALCIFLCSCSEKGESSKQSSSEEDAKDVLVGNIPISFPLVSKPSSLNVLATGHNGIDQESVFMWKKYEEMTGVNVNWTTVTKDKRAEEVHSTLLNNKNIDMILRCKVSSSRLTQYGEGGLILDLAKDEMLKKNAPNCWAYLTSHPDTLASIMNPDGTIYALPQVNSGAELRVARKIFINKKWLANVNMSIPKTTDEFYNLLKAFKSADANGNGDPNDEIPLCSMDWSSLQEAFFGAFGLGNRGLHNQDVDFDEKSGKVRLISSSDGYKDYLEYFNKLYTEELLDKYIFTVSTSQWYSNASNDLIGAFVSTNLASLPADKVDNWVAVEEALTGPNGDKMWSAIRANFHSTGAAIIPTACSNPELCLRWLDFFWTDKGTLFYHMGIENETYVKKDDGTYDYVDEIYNEITTRNLSFDDAVALYSPYPGGSNPTVEIAPYFMGGEMADVPAKAARELFKYGPDEYWPTFNFTAQENEKLGAVRSDITKYRDEMCIKFVTGTKPLSEWDDYVSKLESLKTSDLLEVYQAAVDRYNEMK